MADRLEDEESPSEPAGLAFGLAAQPPEQVDRHYESAAAPVPFDEFVEPSVELAEPFADAVLPFELAEPSVGAVLPSEVVDQPFGDAVPPFADAVQPFADAVLPFVDAVLPSGDAVQPSGDAVRPSGDAVQPSGDAVRPSGGALPFEDVLVALLQLRRMACPRCAD